MLQSTGNPIPSGLSNLDGFIHSISAAVDSVNKKEEFKMTENEEKLIDLIRNSKDPEKALITAVNIIVDFLKNTEGRRLRHE